MPYHYWECSPPSKEHHPVLAWSQFPWDLGKHNEYSEGRDKAIADFSLTKVDLTFMDIEEGAHSMASAMQVIQPNVP